MLKYIIKILRMVGVCVWEGGGGKFKTLQIMYHSLCIIDLDSFSH
jgi:hypothetical protein